MQGFSATQAVSAARSVKAIFYLMDLDPGWEIITSGSIPIIATQRSYRHTLEELSLCVLHQNST